MAGGNAVYEGTVPSNILKVAGIELASAGDIDPEGKYKSIVYKDRDRYIYRKLVIKDGVLSGCILYGDISDYRKILKAINEKRDVRGMIDAIEKGDLSML